MKIKALLIMCAMAINTVTFGLGLDLKIITYNIRYNNPGDSLNAWPHRKDEVLKLIHTHAPDIFGLQEALLDQVNDIASKMPGFDWIGVGREDGVNRGEYAPIFYNSRKYQLKEQGCFWLSESPHIPSKSWDAALPRICTFVLLEDYDTRQNFWVFNTHMDHQGEKARHESARLILRKINELNEKKLPVILMGDFNALPDENTVKLIKRRLEDCKEFSLTTGEGPEGTFNGFDFNSPLTDRIDYIFVNKEVVVNKYVVLIDSNGERYPSDHLPVYAEL
ncbi:MAG: endonuclease/exonuclease/phosphatase family protein, partial [Prolixibacteraceae bacterium]